MSAPDYALRLLAASIPRLFPSHEIEINWRIRGESAESGYSTVASRQRRPAAPPRSQDFGRLSSSGPRLFTTESATGVLSLSVRTSDDAVEGLQIEHEALRLIHAVFQASWMLLEWGRLHDSASRLFRVVGQPSRSVAARLLTAQGWFETTHAPRVRERAADLLVLSIAQQVMGTGWRRPGQPKSLMTWAVGRSRGDSDEAELARGCLRAMLEPAGASMPLEAARGLIGLLPRWVGIDAAYREGTWCSRPSSVAALLDDDDKVWKQGGCELRRLLAPFLQHARERTLDQAAAEDSEADAALPTPRQWLALWLVHTLLTPVRLRPSEDARLREPSLAAARTRFRADLAYVVRENLRTLAFGRRADFSAHHGTYLLALRTLVAFHLTDVCGLQGLDVTHILEEIGREGPIQDGRQAIGHLQHVLFVYLVGMLLLEAQVGDGRNDASLADRLAASDPNDCENDTHGGRELRQAFGLAALFHDTGYLLFPRRPRTQITLAQHAPDLADLLAGVDARARKASREFTQRVVAAIEGEPEYLDPVHDRPLREWLSAQLAAPAPDHGLLSAYYLHLSSHGNRSVAPRVRGQALRAALLHNARVVPVDTARDPCAALLLLCNELFDWDPDRASGIGPTTIESALHLPPEHGLPTSSLFSRVDTRELTVQASKDGDGTLSVILSPPPAATDGDVPRGWPCFELRLRPGLSLDMPAHHVWLSKAQRLGRLRVSRSGLAPMVVIEGDVHPEIQGLGVDSLALLEAVAPRVGPPLRLALQSWLQRQRSERQRWLEKQGAKKRKPRYAQLPNEDEPPILLGVSDNASRPVDDLAFDLGVELDIELKHLDREIAALMNRWSAGGSELA